jgi:hypothetical protein
MADGNYNALLGDGAGYIDPRMFRTQLREPNALMGPVWENDHAAPQPTPQRPADWAVTSGVADTVAHGVLPWHIGSDIGNGIGTTYNALRRGDYGGAAEAGLPLAAMALFPMLKRGQPKAAHVPLADMEAVAPGQGFGSSPKPTAGQSPLRPDGWPAWGDSAPEHAMAFVREGELSKQVQPLLDAIQYPNGTKVMERFEAERVLMRDPKMAALLQDYHSAQVDLHHQKQASFSGVKLAPGERLHDEFAAFNEPTPPGQALPNHADVMSAVSGAGANALMAPEQPKGIRAFHGSPHDFDRFDTSKIGTGEGAQAYGHGLYFAENEGVAKSYRNALSPTTTMINGIDVDGFGKTGPQNQALRYVAQHKGDIDAALGHLRNYRNDKYRRAAADWLKDNRDAVQSKVNGHMYEVNIKADPEHFLDWDKPLSQQSEKIQQLYNERVAPSLKTREIGVNTNLGPLTDVMHPEGGSLGVFTKENLADVLSNPSKYAPTKGSDFYNAVARKSVNGDWGNPGDFARQQATNALRESGIPGIRYLDQGSRGAGEGSRNYVVFDPATIEILRKYGIALPGAMGTAGAGANALYGGDQ